MEFSKDKFLQIIENIKECYFEVDLKGNITYFNNAFCELTGYSREELFGLNYKYIADEENQKKVFKGFNTVYKTGEPLTDFEYQFKNKSGKKLIGETSVYLKYDSEGNKIGFYGLFRDITKRKEEEIRFREELEQLVNIKTLELRESEEKYHQLFNKALYSIALFDLEGNIVDCNNATSNLLSTHTLKEYIGKNYREFWTYHEKDKPLIDLFNNIFTDIIKTGKTLNFEFPIHRTIGRIIWCYATASKIKIGKKEFIQLILIDISAQKEAQQRLKESEEKYRSLVENAHEGVWALDENDDTIFVNPKICKMLGYTKDEIMGKNLHLFLEAPMSELINSYRKRREKGLKDTYELEFMKKDGTILSASINAASILNGNGEFKGSFAYITDITNRKIAEQKLKESEEMYRLLAENIHDIIVGLDKKFQIEYINEEVVKKVLGTAKKYVLGKNVLDFVHPDDKAVGLNSLVKGIKDKEGIMEVRIRHQKGHYIWFEVKGKAFLNNKGELKGILIARNITERKHAEEKLRESEEQYRTLVETMTDGLVVIDENSCFTYLNMSFSKMIEYSYNEILNTSIFNYLDKKNQRIVEEQLIKRRDGESQPYELMWTRKDGQKIYTIMAPKPLIDAEGNYIGSFAVITNITERITAEQKLKESEERYRNLIESVPFSIALIDQQGKIIYCNPATEKLLGYKREELLGYEFKNLPAINPRYVPILLKRFKKVLNGEILPPLEIELYKKDGSPIWIRYQSTLLKLGDIVLLQTVINDITEHKKADLLIEEEILKLKELDQIRKDLISRVSHELKTPLVSVCGAAELLLDLYIEEFKDEPKELIEMIEKGGKRLKYLVDNLVDITRIEYKKFELEKNKNDINQLIRDCLKEMMYLIKKRELNFELDLLEDLFLEIDKVRIEQVILNLLSNAIKNTPPNGKILVKSLRKDNHVEISIKDTGIGLTKEEMARLFTRFGKIERYGNGLEYVDIQGTGLGLYISKEIIDLHEGEIWAESVGRDKGSTFTIKIPIKS